jgi:hypothetical protein
MKNLQDQNTTNDFIGDYQSGVCWGPVERGEPLGLGQSLRRGGTVSYCLGRKGNKNELSISAD